MNNFENGISEGRIAVLKNGFLGRPLRAKRFERRQLAVSWAVLAHNLWVLARLPRREAVEESPPDSLAGNQEANTKNRGTQILTEDPRRNHRKTRSLTEKSGELVCWILPVLPDYLS